MDDSGERGHTLKLFRVMLEYERKNIQYNVYNVSEKTRLW